MPAHTRSPAKGNGCPDAGRRIKSQVVALVLVALGTGAAILTCGYLMEKGVQLNRLSEIAGSRARRVEATFRSHSQMLGLAASEEAFRSTLEALKVAQDQFSEFGRRGEFMIAESRNDSLHSLLPISHDGGGEVPLLGPASTLAEPMRRALRGESGTLIGLDCRGTRVLAAYEPVRIPGHRIGLVAKVDLAEIRRPYWVAAGVGAGSAGVLVLLGGFLIRRAGDPLIRRIKESESRYRRLFEDSGQPIFLTSVDGTILDLNQAGADLLEGTREDLLGLETTELFVDPEDWVPLIAAVRADGTVRGWEIRLKGPGGRVITCLATVHFRPGRGPEKGQFETLLLDISDRKRAEEELRRSEERYFDLFQHAPDMLISVDMRTNRIRECNSAVFRKTGFSSEEIIGRDLTEFYPPSHRQAVLEARALLLADRGVEDLEVELRRKDGTAFPVGVNAAAVRDESGTVLAGRLSLRDLSEQREARDRLDRILEGSRDGFWDWPDFSRREVWWSDSFLHLLGYEPGALAPTLDLLEEMVHPKDREEVGQRIRTVLGGADDFESEYRIRKKDGSYAWFSVKGRIYRGADGNPAGMAGSARDISMRKALEESLRESESFLRQVVEEAEVGIAALDSDLRFVLWNPFMARVSGLEEDRVLGRRAEEVLPFLGETGGAEALRRVLRGEPHTLPDLPFAIPETGMSGWATGTLSPLRKPRGEVKGVLGIVREVSKRRAAEEAARASQERFRTLYESVQAGVLVQARDGRFLHANQVATRVLGISPGEVEERSALDPAWEMVDEEGNPVPGSEHPSMTTLRTGEAVRGAVRGLFSGDPDRTRWLIINTEPLFEEGESRPSGVVVTFQDITALRRYESQIQTERDRAQRYLEVAEVVLLALSREGRIEMINRKGCELLEAEESDLLGEDWFETALPAETAPRVRKVFDHLMRGEEEVARREESPIVSASGKVLTLSWNNSVLRDGSGEIVGTFSSGEDITARRCAEAEEREARAALERSQELLDRTGEMARVGGWEVDLRKGTVYWTRVTRMIHEVPDDYEPTLEEAVAFFHPEDRPVLEEAIQRAVTAGTPYDLEVRFITAGGRHLWTRCLGRATVVEGECVRLWGTFQDVTARREAEKALWKSEEKYRRLFNQMQSGFALHEMIWDEKGEPTDYRFLEVNPAFEVLTGLQRERMIGRTVLEVLPETEPEWVRRYGEVVRTGEPRTFEMGSAALGRHYQVSAFPTGGDRFAVTFFDVTATVAAEQARKENEERLELAQKVGRVGLLDRNLLTDVEVWSDTTYEIFGLDPQTATPGPETWMQRIHPEDRHQARASLGRLLSGEDAPDQAYRVVRPDGTVRWVRGVARVFPSPSGEPLGRLLATIHDITELKAAEEALQRSDARFRSVFESSPVGIVVVAATDGKILTTNRSFARLLGYEVDELVGLCPWDITHPEDREVSEGLSMGLLRGSSPGLQFEKRFLRKDGTPVWCRLTASAMGGGAAGARFGVGMVEDISEARAAREEILRTQERLRALAARLARIREEERTAISRELHDELGQSLTGLRMDLAMERAEVPEDRPDLRSRLEGLIRTVDGNVELVRALSSRLRPPVLDIMGLGPAIHWHVEEQKERSVLEFHLDLPESGPDLPEESSIAIFRIAQEALTNVHRHSGARAVWIRLRREENSMVLEVEDDGVGLPAKKIGAPVSLGLLGMEERAVSIGGELTFADREGGGTLVRLVAPTSTPHRKGSEA